MYKDYYWCCHGRRGSTAHLHLRGWNRFDIQYDV